MDIVDAWLDLVTGSACVGCRRPGRLLCVGCRDGLPTRAVVARPEPRPEGLAETRAAGAYADPVLRGMVLAHKEQRAFTLARPLGEVLAVAVRELVGRPSLAGVRVLLVPVPSRRSVVAARGHDPMLRVTRAAGAVLRREGYAVVVAPVLRQAERPLDQGGLGGDERRANVRHTMAARTPVLRRLAHNPTPSIAIVCDDVVTTGSTAREAQRALTAVGIGVAGVAGVTATVRPGDVLTTDPLTSLHGA